MLEEQERRSALREEAASWFAAMQGPDAQSRDQEFKAWLAADPEHRIAYARIAEVYSMGKSLVSPTKAEADVAPSHRRHAVALAAAVAVILLSFFAIVWIPAGNEGQKSGPVIVADAGQHTAKFASRVGQIRKVQLADGSKITLDTNSIVSMRFTPSSRSLRLEQGKARFEVAHEKRPFTVSVGDATVTAHGTVFDVGFRSDHIYFVRLLRGSVDVAQADHVVGHDITSKPKLLRPGQVVEAGGFGVRDLPASFAPAAGESWTSKMRQFDNVRVGDLISEANRYSHIQIRQPVAEIADRRASGTFAIDEPRRLATNLSLLFGLKIAETPDSSITLTPSDTKISQSGAEAP